MNNATKSVIKNVQIMLNKILRTQKMPTMLLNPTNGILDEQTKNSIANFQKQNQLSPTGVIDKITFDKIVGQYKKIIEGEKKYLPIPISLNSHQTGFLQNKMNVYYLQVLINEVAQKFTNILPIEINGKFNKETLTAVRELQEIMGFASTGNIDQNFWNKLIELKGQS